MNFPIALRSLLLAVAIVYMRSIEVGDSPKISIRVVENTGNCKLYDELSLQFHHNSYLTIQASLFLLFSNLILRIGYLTLQKTPHLPQPKLLR